MADSDVALTPPQVAKRWRCGNEKVVKLIRAGILAGFDTSLPGSTMPRFRIMLSEVERFERERCPRPPEPKARRRRKPPTDAVEFV